MNEAIIALGLAVYVTFWALVIYHRLVQVEENTMATLDEITAAVGRVSDKVDAGNASLTNIEADIADLKAQVAAGGMTAEQEATALGQIADLEAKVAAQADRLAAIDDATPGAPAPEPTPAPTPEP